jgi:putative alpha-1,2-mannosidase
LKTSIFIILSCALLLAHQSTGNELFDAAQFVNPFIGTGKYQGPSKWGKYGGTFPGAVVPFGMVQITPETRLHGGPLGYYYEDDRIHAFSIVNHMSGYPNGSAGNIKFMPFFAGDSAQVFSVFSHKNESAEPGYYAVDLFDQRMQVELTATERTALVQLSVRETSPLSLSFWDVDSLVQSNSREIRGKCGGYYFVACFNHPVKAVYQNRLFFESHNQLLLKFAVSLVSFKNAKENMQVENRDWDFEQTKTLARKKWNDCLAKVEVNDDDKEKLIVFYTALYHSMLLPFVSSDNNGDYIGDDGNIHRCESGEYYSGFSPWDTFRTLHPLLTLLQPDRQADMIESLLLMYRQTGKLFDGPMTGNHAIPVIVDSYFKGLADFDIDLAVAAMNSAIWNSRTRN